MKVCDEGTYTLLDADRKILVEKENDYVPNGLLPGEFGDYLAMKIDETGLVTNWKKNADLCNFSDD